jgi:phosphatidylinositol alpha-mannosyltransferase
VADALAELLDDPGRRAALRAAGLAFARRFTWPEVARRTLAVYEAARRCQGA